MAEPDDPAAVTRRLSRPQLPRRFYAEVAVAPHAAGFAILLDGRTAKTPGRKPLVVSAQTIAAALATEWRAQADEINPATMPLTRLVNVAIDRVAAEAALVRAEIVKYAMTDAVCYRAASPSSLVAAEDAVWSPLTAWAEEELGVRLRLAIGVVQIPQDPMVADAVAAALAPLPALILAALHVATTLTGSAIIALALLMRRLTAETAWAAAYVDEDWQMSQWGRDEIALAARAARRRDFDAATLVLGDA